MRDLVPADERIRHIHLDGAANIGEKRNFGCSRARGEIVAHFDDDDWSGPGRLADQYARFGASGKSVVGYSSMEFRCEHQGVTRRWLCTPKLGFGTALFYRRAWWEKHPFLAKQIAEDGAFVEEAMRHGEYAATDAGDLMWASIHDGNTSPRRTSDAGWRELS